MSLVEDAKKINYKRARRNKAISEEEIDLLFAYLRAEISIVQMQGALFDKGILSNKTNCSAWFYRCVETAYNHGLIRII